MMEALAARGAALGEARAAEVVETLAARVEDQIPGVSVIAGQGEVVLSGRGLARRMLVDPALRWIGGLLR